MSAVLLAWGLIGGGVIVGVYALLLRFYTLRFWDSQTLAAFYLLLMLVSLLFLTASTTAYKLFTSPHVPALVLLLWGFLTITYIPVKITRTIVRHGVFHVLTPTTLFIISIFLSLLLALLFLTAFLSGSTITI